MSIHRYLACDLGAESGRVMLGTLADGKISLEELHRFASATVSINGTLRWDVLKIYEELKAGLRKAAALNVPIAGVSTDSWGVDYVLLKDSEPQLSVPFHYRDARTDDGFAKAFAKVSREEIFAETGIQFLPFNTIYQLHDDAAKRPELLGLSDGFLNIGDYFNWLFSGVRKIEESMASTTQLYNPGTHSWSKLLIDKLGVPAHIFPQVVPSGTVLGPLETPLSEEIGLKNVQVLATCSHDTGAAVAAVPASGEGWAYLSSGTWSLLGVESPVPVLTEQARTLGFTNEIGYGGSIRLLTNIVGLWIVQECRRGWEKEGCSYTYDQLTEMASKAEPLRSLINPAYAPFGKPGNMPGKIADYCLATGQPVPREPGEFLRCAFESLALLYRVTLEKIESLTGEKIVRLHIVGGGAKNRLLNQLSANATGRRVLAGPVEATALGNVLIQALALGHIGSLADLRKVVADSFSIETSEPQDGALWENAYQKFKMLPSDL